jgi:hypothetical protein
MTPLSDILFWKKQFWTFCDKIEGIGRPTDLAGEFQYRDAEVTRDFAHREYRDKLLTAWAARNARRIRRAA